MKSIIFYNNYSGRYELNKVEKNNIRSFQASHPQYVLVEVFNEGMDDTYLDFYLSGLNRQF